MIFEVVPASPHYLPQWGEMRFALWPWSSPAEHADEARKTYLSGNSEAMALLALDNSGQAVAFAEARLRRDYVEGCDTTPVAFLEGIFVVPEMRGKSVARALVDRFSDWGRAAGCTEFASNALLDNTDSHAFHAAIGFAETERVVFFKKEIQP